MSVKDLITKAFQKKQESKQTATEEYRDLLHLSATDGLNDHDESRLLELIAELRITDEQAIKDARTVETLLDLQKIVSAKAENELAYTNATKKHDKALEDRHKVIADINAKVTAANSEYQEAFDKFHHAQKSVGVLKELAEQHPHLVK